MEEGQGCWIAVEMTAGVKGSKSLKDVNHCGLHPEHDGSYCYMRRPHCTRSETLARDRLGLLLFSRKGDDFNQERSNG